MTEPPPQPGVLARSESTIIAEQDLRSLQKALHAVNENVAEYKERGLSPLSFWFGIVNVGLSGFLLGGFSSCYWLWQVIKSTGLLYVTWVHRRAKREELYLLDFCWIFAFVYTAWGWLCVALHSSQLAWGGVEQGGEGQEANANAFHELLRPITSSKGVFLGMWGLANGPLALACILLGNALVLHDKLQMSSLFIHISPPFVTWGLRWIPSEVERRFPGIFWPQSDDVSFSEIVKPALGAYFLWFVLYAGWLIARGRYHHVKKTGYDTVYTYSLRSQALFRSLVGCPSIREVEEYQTHLRTVCVYLGVHAAYAMATVSLSVIFWNHTLLHTIYCFSLFAVSAWNGSQRYYKMMTRYFEKRLEMLLNESIEVAASKTSKNK